MPGAAERPGWNTFPGCCWVYVLRQRRRLVSHQLRLPSQLQPPPRTPQAAPTKVVIPSTVKPAKEAEKAREVGVPRVCARRGGHRTAGRHVLRPILVRERKKLLLEIGATRMWVSVDRLKPHAGVKTPTAAQLPPCGCLRKP